MIVVGIIIPKGCTLLIKFYQWQFEVPIVLLHGCCVVIHYVLFSHQSPDMPPLCTRMAESTMATTLTLG